MGLARRSAPEVFSAAQSSGLWPGARTTFSRFLDLLACVGGRVVVGGGIKEDAEDGAGGPGIRGTGSGGGGIRVDGEMRCVEDGAGAEEIRCALPMAGKAGGELSSASGSSIVRVGFVGVVGDSSSSVVRELLCCVESVGSHVRR